MAQHDYNISNQSFPAVRADINNALVALATKNSGPLPPSETYAFLGWYDTTDNLVKERNSTNTAWIVIGQIDQPAYGLASLASPQLSGTPTAPTAPAGTNTVQLATTAFVAAAIAPAAPVLGTAQNSTSGTAISFTGIPSYAKRVTLLFSGVSTSTDTGILVQLGVGTTPTTAGYANGYTTIATPFDGNSYAATATSGVPVYSQAAFTTTGQITFTNITGNTWLASGAFSVSSGIGGQITSGGSVALSGPLGMIRATVGAGAFDLGLMNIVIE